MKPFIVALLVFNLCAAPHSHSTSHPRSASSTTSNSVSARAYSGTSGRHAASNSLQLPASPHLSAPRPASSVASHHSSSRCSSCARNGEGQISRSSKAKGKFERQKPCPTTGRTSGPCAGYVVDHVKPLACGGEDKPSNMQWQSREAAKVKDRWERSGCVH